MSIENSSLREMLDSCANRGERIEVISHWLYSSQKEAAAGTPPPDWDVLRQAGCELDDVEEMVREELVEVNYPSMPFRWLDPVEHKGVIPCGSVAYDDAGWTTCFRKEAGDTGYMTLVGGLDQPITDENGNPYWPRMRPTKKLIRARQTTDSTLLDLLRQAMHETGTDAKPAVIIRRAKVGEQRGREGLRDLQRLGEYHGFARDKPGRW